MGKDENISSFSAGELAKRRARRRSKTDLVPEPETATTHRATTILQQLEEDGFSADWFKDAQAVQPDTKKLISLRLDSDVVEWFRTQGPGYQTRINSVLKAYIKHAPSGPAKEHTEATTAA